jgi:hypothetical protein
MRRCAGVSRLHDGQAARDVGRYGHGTKRCFGEETKLFAALLVASGAIVFHAALARVERSMGVDANRSRA